MGKPDEPSPADGEPDVAAPGAIGIGRGERGGVGGATAAADTGRDGSTAPVESAGARDLKRLQVGRFELIERVGAGGFGEVWRAYDPHLEREIAIKLAHAAAVGEGQIDLMLHEARAAGGLRHPAIVTVHEAGATGQVAYVVSDYIRGETLEQRLKSGPLPPRSAAEIARALAEALDYAHGRGVVHRDVKPSNVILDDQGRPHLMDFGVARRVTAAVTISRAGEAIGTPAYMSPEQAEGDMQAVGPLSDVYALGLMLYEMLAGRRAYPGTAAEALRDVLRGPPRPLGSIRRDVPRGLANIVATATARRPPDRYPSAAAMAGDLSAFLAGRRVAARRSRRGLLFACGAMSLAAALAGVMFAISRSGGLPFSMENSRSAAPDTSRPMEGASHLDAGGGAPTAVGPVSRRVLVSTEPPEAKVRFFPLDLSTGEPDPSKRFSSPEETPCVVELPPGEYFVVAVLADGRFNETSRWVPYADEPRPLNHDNLFWDERPDGIVALGTIPIPDVPRELELVDIPPAEVVVASTEPLGPGRKVALAGFSMTATELSTRDLRSISGPFPESLLIREPADEAAVLTYDQAVVALERLGLRPPTEFEWEYVAGWGTPDWGAIAAQAGDLGGFGPVGAVSADRAGPDGRVLGLRSGPAEWTASFGRALVRDVSRDRKVSEFESVLGRNSPSRLFGGDYRRQRVVRGGGDDVQTGSFSVDPATRNPRGRSLVDRFDRTRKIAVRGVRSSKPHDGPEDFARDRGPADTGPGSPASGPAEGVVTQAVRSSRAVRAVLGAVSPSR